MERASLLLLWCNCIAVMQCQLTPIVVQPVVAVPLSNFGASVDISGESAVIGASDDGSAYFFEKASSSSWIQTSKHGNFTPSYKLPVAMDGTHAVIGVPAANEAHIYRKFEGGEWEKQWSHNFASDIQFGEAVDISGTIAIIGAPGYGGGNGNGGAFMYIQRATTEWDEDGILTQPLSGMTYDFFGGAVGISGDYAVVGTATGGAWVFQRVGPSNWQHQYTFVKLDGPQLLFGQSVGIYGNRVFVGEPGASGSGAAFMYTNDSDWSQQSLGLSSEYAFAGDNFGRSVQVYGDFAIVGSALTKFNSAYGSASIYWHNGITWELQDISFGPQVINADYGAAVSISSNAAIVGIPGVASAYIFDISPLQPTITTSSTASSTASSTGSFIPSSTVTATSTDAQFESSLLPSNGNSVFGIVIAVVGVFVVLLVVCCVIFAVWIRKNRPVDGNAHQPLESTYSAVDMSGVHDIEKLMIINVIGKGQFGEVYLGQWNGTPCACKKLSSADADELSQEASLISKLSHPNIVMLLGIHTNLARETYLVFEYVSGGSLIDFLPKNKRRLTAKELTSISIGTAQGMAYLESKKIVHRDLAARNILINETSLEAKISDFGLSRSDLYQKSATSKVPVRWSAPEVLHQGMSTLRSDVFSFGVVLWEIFSYGLLPFEGYSNMEASQLICDETIIEKLAKPAMCPDNVYEVMLRCWVYEPERRISFQEILVQLRSIGQNPTGNASKVLASSEQDMYM